MSKEVCTCTTVKKAYLTSEVRKTWIRLRLLRACEHRSVVADFGNLDALARDEAAQARARAECERWSVPLQRLYDRLVKAIPPKPELTQEEADYESSDDHLTADECVEERIPIKTPTVRRAGYHKKGSFWDPDQPVGGKMSPKAWAKEMARRKQALADALKQQDGSSHGK